MDNVKVAVIGAGGIGIVHTECVDACPGAELVAVVDADLERAQALAERFDCVAYGSDEQLLAEADVEAVTIATPHYYHTPIACRCLDAGKHVLTEKPIAVHVNDARKMAAAAERNPGCTFAAMFNYRTQPLWKKIRQLVVEGQLGALQRVNWTVTTWFRNQVYFDSGAWRGTWRGEGGGALLNQCPHNLDMLVWLCGMPEAVQAYCLLGSRHAIEVEDEVVAVIEFPGNMLGTFVTSTGESPGSNRFELVGELGTVVVEGGRLTFRQNRTAVREHIERATTRFDPPEIWDIEIPLTGTGESHQGIIDNFVDAIAGRAELIAPATEGVCSVELGNAILLAALERREVPLPLDGDAFEARLQHMIDTSTFKKGDVKKTDLSFKGSSMDE
ncbi:MAG: Gfo/Idh/MocA family protein [Planctomycetota bacterium]